MAQVPGIATSADFLPVLERLAQGFAVHELHFRAERDALREPGDGHAGEAAVDEAPDERARGFRFNGVQVGSLGAVISVYGHDDRKAKLLSESM